MNRKVAPSGLHRVLARSPVVFALICALMLATFSFFSSNKFQNHYGVLRVTGTEGLRQVYEPEMFRLSSTKRITELPKPSSSEDSLKSLKWLVRDALDRGLVVIVNASDADAAKVLADHSQGARLDISGALDGVTGDILVEVMQEIRNVEDMADEVMELKRKIELYETEKGPLCANENSKTNASMVPLQGGHGFRPFGRALHSLMIYSTSRYAHDEFTAVGIGAPSLLPKSFFEMEENSCSWIEWDDKNSSELPSPLTTTARVQRGQKMAILIQEGDSPYAVVVIKCWFADPAGSNGYGGHLFINTTEHNYVPLLTELPESIDKIQFEGPLQHRFAVCTPPIWRPLPTKILQQWLQYHHHILGRERVHYFIYAAIPLDAATLHTLQPLLDQGSLTIVDLTSDMALVGGESQFPSTLFARNDCVQRSRFFADWAILWDFNEFLQILPQGNFQNIVNASQDLPFFSFGNLRWSSAYCTPEETSNNTLETSESSEPWVTDRMIFHLDLPACHKDTNASADCFGGDGDRRYIVNPRKVVAVHRNYMIDPSWGGVDISTKKARINQWIGNFMSTASNETCTFVKNPDEITPSIPVDGYWYKDMSFAVASRAAHNVSLSAAHDDAQPLQNQQTAENLTDLVR